MCKCIVLILQLRLGGRFWLESGRAEDWINQLRISDRSTAKTVDLMPLTYGMARYFMSGFTIVRYTNAYFSMHKRSWNEDR